MWLWGAEFVFSLWHVLLKAPGHMSEKSKDQGLGMKCLYS